MYIFAYIYDYNPTYIVSTCENKCASTSDVGFFLPSRCADAAGLRQSCLLFEEDLGSLDMS